MAIRIDPKVARLLYELAFQKRHDPSDILQSLILEAAQRWRKAGVVKGLELAEPADRAQADTRGGGKHAE